MIYLSISALLLLYAIEALPFPASDKHLHSSIDAEIGVRRIERDIIYTSRHE
jgi:hypothetical protein